MECPLMIQSGHPPRVRCAIPTIGWSPPDAPLALSGHHQRSALLYFLFDKRKDELRAIILGIVLRVNRWTGSIILIAAALLTSAAPAQQAPPSSFPSNPTFRSIHVQVLGLGGDPTPRRQAHLIGLSRGSFRPDDDNRNLTHWDFITDAKGRFSVQLGEFNTRQDPEQRPGWGTYALIVDGDGKDGGAVSNEFIASIKKRDTEPLPPDWEWGSMLFVPPEGMELVLKVKKGLELKGHLWDVANPRRPLAGISIHTNNDLHADSHTGHGGEIFNQSTVTDPDGAFTISHIYPVKFYIGVGQPYGFRSEGISKIPKNPPGYWLKTKSDGLWKNDVLDEVTPKEKEDIVYLEMLGTAQPSFEYSGRILDNQNQPIAGAKVSFGLSYHPQVATYEDDHSFPNASTDSQGNYSLMLGTPWVRGVAVEAEGYARFDRWTKGDSPSIGPGKYDFTLHRK